MAKEEAIELEGTVTEVSPYDLTRGRITFRHKS
jgi:translation initiation factor IF-1